MCFISVCTSVNVFTKIYKEKRSRINELDARVSQYENYGRSTDTHQIQTLSTTSENGRSTDTHQVETLSTVRENGFAK